MYKVYSDNYLLYADNLDAYKIVSPQLQLELNKAGQFSFSIYPNHPCYGLIKKLKSVITVYQDNEIIFRGRVLNSEQGWHKEEKIIAEGELAFLNDSVIRPYDFQSAGQISISDLFALFINEHNAQVDEYKRFKIGRVTVDDGDSTNDSNMISRANEDYDTAWNAITKKLLEPLGGYLIVRHEEDGNYIDYLDDVSILAAQTIEFGKNLTDVLKTVKGEDVVTAIIPLGAKDSETGERLTIAPLNNDLDYLVNEDQAALYGRIFKTVVWDDVTLAENLLADKAALNAELAPSGICVNCVAPGVIKTDMLSSFDDATLSELAKETPLGRLGTPEDIANVLLFLASDKADFITGQVISPNGGFII